MVKMSLTYIPLQIISYDATNVKNVVKFCVPTWSILADPVTRVGEWGQAGSHKVAGKATCRHNKAKWHPLVPFSPLHITQNS